MSFQLDPDKLRRYVGRRGGGTEREMNQKGIKITNAARALCSNDMVNVRTGVLRSSIKHELVHRESGNITLHVGSNVDYALIVHEGRGPVFAKPGGVLGPMPGIGYRKWVGPAAPRPFLTTAMRSVR
jgi:hypothetical protein